jgi:hypothetical protein
MGQIDHRDQPAQWPARSRPLFVIGQGDKDWKPPGGLLPINADFRVTAFLDRVESFPGSLKHGLIISYWHVGATTFV